MGEMRSGPTTGGYYFDRETGALSILRRNVRSAWGEIQAGDAGRVAIGFALGAVALAAARRLWDEVNY